MNENKHPIITVIIPFYGNQNECVIEAVESLYKSTEKNIQMILIDNASTAGASDIIKVKFPEAKLIIFSENKGVTGGRNAGIENLFGNEDYVVFFDSDQVVDKNMLTELIRPFSIDKTIGITTPKIYFHPDFLDSAKNTKTPYETLDENSSHIIWSAGTDINMTTGQILFRGGEDAEEYRKDAYVNVAPAVLCCSIEVVKKVGLFDDIYFAVYEDTDYSFRARKLGYKIYYCSKAFAWHKIYYDPEGSAKKLLTRLYYVGRNRIIFMKRFAPNFSIFVLFLPVYFAYYTLFGLKFRNFKSILDFYRGSFVGFITK